MPNKNNIKAIRGYWKERGRIKYAKRRRLGVCVRSASHGPAAPGRTRCAKCIEAGQAQERMRYLRDNPTARANRCGFCGQEGHNIRRCDKIAQQEQRGAA
jgi:hypothetical protein